MRWAFGVLLAEGVFRFLALVNVADALSVGATKKQRKDWKKKLSNPSMGKQLLHNVYTRATSTKVLPKALGCRYS